MRPWSGGGPGPVGLARGRSRRLQLRAPGKVVAEAEQPEPDRRDVDRDPGALFGPEEDSDHAEEDQHQPVAIGRARILKRTGAASPRATARR